MRSLMYIPAKEKMLAKIEGLKADAYIIDLEDSILPEKKKEALQLTYGFLKEYSFNRPTFVRINEKSYKEEIALLSEFESLGFMLVKFDFTDKYSDVYEILNSRKTIGLIETPLGLVNIGKMKEHTCIDYYAFGAEDFTAKMNMENTADNLMFAKSLLLTYCRVYDKQVFDTPSFQIQDMERFEKEVLSAVEMGFDGKQLIHPKHVDFINQSFNRYDFNEMIAIVKEYENKQEAVCMINGRAYEKMHINRYKRILKECGGIEI